MSNSAGRNDNVFAKAQKLSVLPTSLDIIVIRQHYIRILYFCEYSRVSKVVCILAPIECYRAIGIFNQINVFL